MMRTETEGEVRTISLPQLTPRWTSVFTGILLLLFATFSFTAVLGKSATYDEPLHVVGGMVHRFKNDFRINPEDPALFGWWASLPHSSDALPLNTNDTFYEASANDVERQWWFVVSALYGRGAAEADHFLNTSRFMFVLLGIVLGALIARWAYEVGGCWAAMAAAILFCFDPNFLAHSSLVKNDVPLSLLMCGLGYCLWRFGRAGKWWWLLGVALACAMALNVKFSGVLFPPVVLIALSARALMPYSWNVIQFDLQTRWARLILVGVALLAMAVASYAVTWAVYGFRYSATTDNQPLNFAKMERTSIQKGLQAAMIKGTLPMPNSQAELDESIQDKFDHQNFALPVRMVIWLQDHRILPEGWLYGFLYTYSTTLIRSAYLMGQISPVGYRSYFPLAMVFKTATATLAAIALLPLAALASWFIPGSEAVGETGQRKLRGWTLICLLLPPTLYFGAALTTNLNLGLRHILPVYPFIYIALGIAFAHLMKRWALPAFIVGGIIALGLLGETAAAYPNYLAFFNLPSGGSHGGLALLGDSNLDWGQDLPALAKWQQSNPERRLYLCYFGTASPAAYGINYVNLIGGWPFGPTSDISSDPGVIAISATNIQGIYWSEQLRRGYGLALQGEKPFEELNGTIYLYNWPVRK